MAYNVLKFVVVYTHFIPLNLTPCYLHPGGYVIVVVCLLATLRKNSQTDLDEIFREGWQWAKEQMLNF